MRSISAITTQTPGLSMKFGLGSSLQMCSTVYQAMDDVGTHVVLRMINLMTSGWLDFSDLKYATLSEVDAAATALESGDLLFNRTNSRELVGKCAIWRPVAGTYSFASLLESMLMKDGFVAGIRVGDAE